MNSLEERMELIKQKSSNEEQQGRNRKELTQVRRTGDWSADSKLCSIKNGWWYDPFFQRLNIDCDSDFIPRRTSLICFGYYVRFRVCDYFLGQFLSCTNEPVQIVSLGCGLDSLYFRLIETHGKNVSKFFDFDYPTVIFKKNENIENDPVLFKLAKTKLKFIPADLRFIHTTGSDILRSQGFDFNAPTIFYSECVVNYLQPEESDNIIRWISENVPRSIYFAYEQANPLDSFGRIMTKHFEKNGCPIHSVHSNGTLEEQRVQLQRHKFHHSFAINAWDAFSEIIKTESNPVPSGVFFDEFEPLIATSLHYSVRIGIAEQMSFTPENHPPRFLMPFTLSSQKPFGGLRTALTIDNNRGFTFKTDLKISGHASVVVGNNIWLIGGRNQASMLQNRITRISCSLSADGFDVTSTSVVENDALARSYSGAAYCTCTDTVFVFGGRKSPATPVLSIVRISKASSASPVVNVYARDSSSITPFPSWRFALTEYTDEENGLSDVFVLGGKCDDASYDIYKVRYRYLWRRPINDLDDQGWAGEEFYPSVSADSPSPRHSHAMCACPLRNSIFVVGGISANGIRLCEDAVWEYSFRRLGWIRWSEFQSFGRKVGHKVVWHGDLLHIIGGYGNDRDSNLETFITTVNFETKKVHQFELELPQPSLFLPFDFSAHVIRPNGSDDNCLVVVGGGGNCFSFGSHYNTECFLFKLPLEP